MKEVWLIICMAIFFGYCYHIMKQLDHLIGGHTLDLDSEKLTYIEVEEPPEKIVVLWRNYMGKILGVLGKIKLSQTQVIAFGFLCVILTGSFLLMLPISTRDGGTTFLQAAFTSVSATCVTGLVVVDTYEHWTTFGQLVILIMIQIGGLGFMTFGVWFSILLKRKIGLKERGILQESVNTLQIGGIVKLVKKVMIGSFIFEGIGAVVLSVRFCGKFGLAKGIYYGIFHSISAFCNAGFDIMGIDGAYISLTEYVGDPIVNITIMSLIVIGGIGFLVWDDISKRKWHIHKYMLHTKIVLAMSTILIFGGAVLFFVIEKNNILAERSLQEQVLGSLFSSVTARTAGFNTLDTAALTDGSKLLTIILMFIGGSPGSTSGGIKTTTLVAMLVYFRSNVLHGKGYYIFHRRLEDDAIKRAGAVLTLNLFLAIAAALLICSVQMIPLTDVLFEVFSAIGTVGMSTGITRELTVISQLTIMALMYCGRIGSLSFAFAFTERRRIVPIQQPIEKISIG